MSSEKRLFLFLALTFGSILGIQYLMDVTGLTPPPKKLPNVAQLKKEGAPVAEKGPGEEKAAGGLAAKDKEKEKEKEKDKGKEEAGGREGPADERPKDEVAEVPPAELVLGSATDRTPGGYRMEVRLQQQGAGVVSVASSRYEAEATDMLVNGKRIKREHEPLYLLAPDFTDYPPTLSMTLPLVGRPGDAAVQVKEGVEPLDEAAAEAGIPGRGELPLAWRWEVVRDDQGRAARPIPAGAKSPAEEKGREVVFRTSTGQPKVFISKTYRLLKGADGFEVDLKFESPEADRALVYRLLGPHGIPIEGEWYASTFRDVFFGQIKGNDVEVVTRSAYDVDKDHKKESPEKFQTLPLKFAGVENQYFASFLEPWPSPRTPEQRWDSEAIATIVRAKADAPQKADVGVEIVSKPVRIGPNAPAVHTYKVFAGPKTAEALAPYGAGALASYRKNQWFGIPGSAWMATSVITPLLDVMYNFTAKVARLLGGRAGNYGVAIILLTLTVRLAMFPIGRKQAIAAKKMQDLQPLLKEIQEKFKDDKEQQTRETWALYKRYKVNPLGGCLPALVQLPIFVGLWQALNNSVHLRHARFLYIENLAAPDMLFHMPFVLPFVGEYFNLLPFLVVALMLVQTKLFSPPATTPEMEQQQKMMKYMMVFMAFMFYKVPSGLGIYFITSSLWQISERLLLPKMTHTSLALGGAEGGGGTGGPGGGNDNGGGGGGRKGGGGGDGPAKPQGRFSQFWGKVLEEASKNPTYRNLTNATPERDPDKERERDRDRDRGKPRARPGRRR